MTRSGIIFADAARKRPARQRDRELRAVPKHESEGALDPLGDFAGRILCCRGSAPKQKHAASAAASERSASRKAERPAPTPNASASPDVFRTHTPLPNAYPCPAWLAARRVSRRFGITLYCECGGNVKRLVRLRTKQASQRRAGAKARADDAPPSASEKQQKTISSKAPGFSGCDFGHGATAISRRGPAGNRRRPSRSPETRSSSATAARASSSEER